MVLLLEYVDYHLLRRKRKKGHVWYIGVLSDLRDSRGRRTYASMRSLKTGDKSLARKRAQAALAEGSLISAKDDIRTFLTDFWTLGKSQYLKSQAARQKSTSPLYAKNSCALIEHYFLPHFYEHGITKLNELNRQNLDEWITDLYEKREENKISPATINKCRQAVNIALGWCERMEMLPKNPMQHVQKVIEEKRETAIYEINELALLFSAPWRDYRTFAAAMVAASTGMRLGEIRGLLEDALSDDMTLLHVKRNWQDGEGLKEPKWGSLRPVPVRRRAAETLSELISMNPYTGNNRFVFYGNSATEPISKYPIQRELKLAMKRCEIPIAGRSFHSLRHSFASHQRGKMGPENVMRTLGHKSLTMTDHYSHETAADREMVRRGVEDYF